LGKIQKWIQNKISSGLMVRRLFSNGSLICSSVTSIWSSSTSLMYTLKGFSKRRREFVLKHLYYFWKILPLAMQSSFFSLTVWSANSITYTLINRQANKSSFTNIWQGNVIVNNEILRQWTAAHQWHPILHHWNSYVTSVIDKIYYLLYYYIYKSECVCVCLYVCSRLTL
jgi:hypothetical protein